jgi:hypothetical protein
MAIGDRRMANGEKSRHDHQATTIHRWPLAAGRWPLAAGRWPLAAGRWPLAPHNTPAHLTCA